MDYRERMRSLREDNDFTQAQLAKIINKSQQGYNHIETGRAELKIDDLIKLCDFYKVSADYFIGRKEKQHPIPLWKKGAVFILCEQVFELTVKILLQNSKWAYFNL